MRFPYPLHIAITGLAVLSLGTSPVAQEMPARQQMTAQRITDAVEDEIAFHPAVALNDVDVHTSEGVVTLTGTVDTVLAKDYARKLAETVKGVRAVSNQILVEPHWNLMDWEIRNEVEQALLYDRATESYEIDVKVDAGIVTLTGTVDSWAEKDMAELVAKGVRGVIAVVNDIDVEPAAARSDDEIRQEVVQRLMWDALVDDGLVSVSVEDEVVSLSGTVGSAAEKTRAITDAYVAGVDMVDASDLDVARWARDDDLKKDFSILNDDSIEKAIENNLLYEPRVISFDVAVEVEDGVATLRGDVDNLQAKRAAAEAARNTFGVLRVENRIRVRPSTPTDEEIEKNIEDAIVRDPYLERYEIDAEVVAGTAYLYGTVDTWFEKGRADTVASTIYGVTEVRNQLAVDVDSVLVHDPYLYDPYVYDWMWYDYEPGVTYRPDAEIREEIRDELWWSPFVDSDQVNVVVDDGVATLTGTVDSWSEKSAATENAFEGGAVWVRNELQVKSEMTGSEQ